MPGPGIALRLSIGALSLLLAACSTAAVTQAPSPSPTPAPTAVAPTATPARPASPARSATGTSVATGEADLGTLIPREVAGHRLTIQVVSGDQLANSPGLITAELLDTLATLGRTPADMSFAYGLDTTRAVDLSISAIRVRGVNADQYLAAYIPVVEALPGSEVRADTLAGRPAVRVEIPGQATGFFLSRGEVMFLIAGTDLALVQEAAGELP